MSGPPVAIDTEQAFEWWYNAGQRRTLASAASEFQVGYSTMRRYADDGDWEIRAGELDLRIQAETDARVAALVGRQRARVMEALATVQGRFFRRLPEQIEVNGQMVKNPAYLKPEELTIADFERAVKLFELLAGNPTFRLALGEGEGVDGDTASALEEMAARVAGIELNTAQALQPVADESGGSEQ